jgi:hypothetical protein
VKTNTDGGHDFKSCGGTGSGFSCKTLENCRQLNPKSVCHGMVLMPSPTISANPMEYFNTTSYLGLSRYDNLYMNINTIFDNEALYRQAIALYGKKTTPTFAHINQLIAASVSSSTASLRFVTFCLLFVLFLGRASGLF